MNQNKIVNKKDLDIALANLILSIGVVVFIIIGAILVHLGIYYMVYSYYGSPYLTQDIATTNVVNAWAMYNAGVAFLVIFALIEIASFALFVTTTVNVGLNLKRQENFVLSFVFGILGCLGIIPIIGSIIIYVQLNKFYKQQNESSLI